MAQYTNTAIVLGDLKEALLHFEYVVPLNTLGGTIGFRPDAFKLPLPADIPAVRFQDEDLLQKLLPPHLAKDPKFQQTRHLFDALLYLHMVKTYVGAVAQAALVDSLVADRDEAQKMLAQVLKEKMTIEDLKNVCRGIVNYHQLQDAHIDTSSFKLSGTQTDCTENSVTLPQLTRSPT